jgi:phosphatidylserine/phosphatidylglycerophosphate/cardiolipin synthase-like enzyme
MSLFIYDSFLTDLRDNGDANFAQRVLRKVLNANGTFRPDADDHRYGGIEDAWIRYVSAGRTAFRAIYIRRQQDILLYRAGPHSIEDNLSAPNAGAPVVEVLAAEVAAARGGDEVVEAVIANRFLQNGIGRKRLLRNFLLGRRLMPHQEVLLISPYVTLAMFDRPHRFGMAIDSLIEDGTKVTLVTRWPTPAELDAYRDLEARGVELLFHASLHAKLYIFTVRRDEGRPRGEFSDAAIIGSANLTEKGFGFDERNFNEELCYELPDEAREGALEFAYQLAGQAVDLPRVRRELNLRR